MIRISPRPTQEQQRALVILHLLMTRQLSGLADCIRNILNGKWDGYTDFAMTELGDMAVLVDRMAKVLELEPEEVKQMGLDRDSEKKEDYLRRHPGATWY